MTFYSIQRVEEARPIKSAKERRIAATINFSISEV